MAMLIESASVEQAYFFSQHLAPWSASCFADLGQVDTAFYAALGQLGSAFMESEQARLSIDAGHTPVRIVER
jgi:TorA maturation chaperone TorD